MVTIPGLRANDSTARARAASPHWASSGSGLALARWKVSPAGGSSALAVYLRYERSHEVAENTSRMKELTELCVYLCSFVSEREKETGTEKQRQRKEKGKEL